MAIKKICGIETDDGIVLKGVAEPNPIAASSMLINTSVNEFLSDGHTCESGL